MIPAVALFLLLCVFSSTLIMVMGGLRTFRDQPPSLNKEENKARMSKMIMEHWGEHLRVLGFAQLVAGVVLAILVLL